MPSNIPGIVPQVNTTALTEQTTSIAGTSGNLQIDLAVLFSQFLNTYVARQIFAVGDPINPLGVATVGNTIPSGAEMALSVRLQPNNPDILLLLSEIRQIRAELCQLNNNFAQYYSTFVDIFVNTPVSMTPTVAGQATPLTNPVNAQIDYSSVGGAATTLGIVDTISTGV
jgi:hypothetical protein